MQYMGGEELGGLQFSAYEGLYLREFVRMDTTIRFPRIWTLQGCSGWGHPAVKLYGLRSLSTYSKRFRISPCE